MGTSFWLYMGRSEIYLFGVRFRSLVYLSVWKSAKSVHKNLKLAALRQWDFYEQRRFPGTKIYTTPANAHQTNKFLSCALANTGEQNGAVLILLGEGRFAGIILKHSKSADLLCKSLLSYVWRVPSSKVLSCKHERLFDLLPLISKYSKKRPGLIAQGEK